MFVERTICFLCEEIVVVGHRKALPPVPKNNYPASWTPDSCDYPVSRTPDSQFQIWIAPQKIDINQNGPRTSLLGPGESS